MKNAGRWLVLFAALALVAVACGDDSAETTTTATSQPITTTTSAASTTTAAGGEARSIDAVEAAITVDGDASDWDAIPGLDLTINPITGEEQIAAKPATVKVAYDAQFVYVLFTVQDDFNWDPADAHLSAAVAVQWAIDAAAGTGMGSDSDAKADEYNSLGMVDLWHWELECAPGDEFGGAVSEAGEGNDPGNDAGCNFDDEWLTDPATREDDNGSGGENSLLGVFGHSNPVADGEGTWTFEIRRPLQTGDATDFQVTAGQSALMGVAYWDPDNSPEGWDDDEHVNSAIDGWIQVNF